MKCLPHYSQKALLVAVEPPSAPVSVPAGATGSGASHPAAQPAGRDRTLALGTPAQL